MVMELTKGLQIEICHLLSHLHQHIKKIIVYFADIGQDPIMGKQVDSFKRETRIMAMEWPDGLQIEICHIHMVTFAPTH